MLNLRSENLFDIFKIVIKCINTQHDMKDNKIQVCFRISKKKINNGSFFYLFALKNDRKIMKTIRKVSFVVYGSIWASWSAWSFCVNKVRVRVRACNTVRGFSCLGKKQVMSTL